MKKIFQYIQKQYFHFLLNTLFRKLIVNISTSYIKNGHSSTIYSITNIQNTYVNEHISNPVLKRKWFKNFLVHCYFLSANTPIENEIRKIGRNEPCPCGSGKKSKKCCFK